MFMKANLVCKGGGMKGIALIGAISCLEDSGYKWDKFAGTSAGALVASLLAVGYTSSEIEKILYDVEYPKFKDKNIFQFFPFAGEILSVSFYKGLYSGNYLENFLQEKFKEKGKTKFKDISINGESRLKMIASDVTRKKLLILPDDLIYYDLDPMEFEIAKAVRMSVSIPLYFYPVELKYENKPCFIVDGGLLSNFPIWIFDTNSKTPTIGLNLSDDENQNIHESKSTVSFLLDVIKTSLYTNEDVYFKEKDSLRIINIPTLDVSATDFNMSKKTMEELYNSGYKSAQTFIVNRYLETYISKYLNSKR